MITLQKEVDSIYDAIDATKEHQENIKLKEGIKTLYYGVQSGSNSHYQHVGYLMRFLFPELLKEHDDDR